MKGKPGRLSAITARNTSCLHVLFDVVIGQQPSYRPEVSFREKQAAVPTSALEE